MELVEKGVSEASEGKTHHEAEIQTDNLQARRCGTYSGKLNVTKGNLTWAWLQAVRLRAEKSYLEQAVQHLFCLELFCDQEQQVRENPSLNPRARVLSPVRRAAAVAAETFAALWKK